MTKLWILTISLFLIGAWIISKEDITDINDMTGMAWLGVIICLGGLIIIPINSIINYLKK